MKRGYVLFSILLLTAASLAQQSTSNPQDRPANPTDHTTYNQPVETGSNWGGWGLLGLLGLAGLLGRRRETTMTDTGYTRDDRTYDQQRRRAS